MTEHTIPNEPPWIVEIDGVSYATPEAVVLLLKAVSEERDTLKNAADRLSAEELIEILADIEHERWSSWMRYQFDNWTDEKIERWKALMETPYEDLSEHSKESDRREARKTLDAILAYAKILEGKDDQNAPQG